MSAQNNLNSGFAAQLAQLAAGAANNATDKATKPAPKLYLNIGVNIPGMGFVSLPFNLALDNMNEREVKGTEEWRKQAVISNHLLKMAKEMVESIESGKDGAKIIPEFQVQAFKRTTENEGVDSATTDELLANMPKFTLS